MNEAWVIALWQRMKDAYGHKWMSLFAEPESLATWRASWQIGLDGISADAIRYALQKMLDCYSEWPPGLGQFRNLCLEMHKPVPLQLPSPKAVKSPEQSKLLLSATRKSWSGRWWIPERVTTQGHVNFVVQRAHHFGEYSKAARFLDLCMSRGIITRENTLGVLNIREPGEDDDEQQSQVEEIAA